VKERKGTMSLPIYYKKHCRPESLLVIDAVDVPFVG